MTSHACASYWTTRSDCCLHTAARYFFMNWPRWTDMYGHHILSVEAYKSRYAVPRQGVWSTPNQNLIFRMLRLDIVAQSGTKSGFWGPKIMRINKTSHVPGLECTKITKNGPILLKLSQYIAHGHCNRFWGIWKDITDFWPLWALFVFSTFSLF